MYVSWIVWLERLHHTDAHQSKYSVVLDLTRSSRGSKTKQSRLDNRENYFSQQTAKIQDLEFLPTIKVSLLTGNDGPKLEF